MRCDGLRELARAQPRTPEASECRRLEQRLRESEMLRATAEREASQLMRALAHLTRMTTLANLWAFLAHDLSQPMTAILANAQAALLLLSRGGSRVEDLRPVLEDIDADAERAGDLFRRVRDLLNAGPREREEVDLNAIIQDAAVMLRPHASLAKVSVLLRLSSSLPRITARRVQIQQVVLNLMLNAVEAMRATSATDRRLELSTEQPGPLTVKASVRDTGRGMPDSERERIFEACTSSDASGLSKSLFVSRAIVQAHGGWIRVENNPDRGVTASFCLQVSGAFIDG